MFKKIIKNTTILSTGTLFSRLLGFIRDVLIAKFFGTGVLLEAFIVAFRLPNLFRGLLGEGFSDSVAVPLLADYSKDKSKLFIIGNHLFLVFSVILSLFTISGIICSKYLVMAIAPGFLTQPDKFHLAVFFTKITFFYLFLIGLTANLQSLLYSLKKFLIPAFSPSLLNLSFIIGILFFVSSFKNYVLIISVLMAGVLQFLLHFFYIRRKGFRLKFDFKNAFQDKVVKKMFKLFLPRIWSAAVYNFNVFVDTILSSLTHIVGEGALAAIYYSNRLIQLPLALIGISISRVATVDLAKFSCEGNWDDFKRLFVFSMQNIFFFTIPITFIFLFLPDGLLDVLFKRGEFNQHSLEITSSALFFYSFGLLFFCMIKVLVHTFYSLKDTITPARTSFFSLLINIILSSLFMFPLGIGGIALGSSLASVFNFFFLYKLLVNKIGKIDWQDTFGEVFKIVVISLLLGVISRSLWENLVFSKYVKIFIVLLTDFAIFLIGAVGFKLKQINYIKKMVKEKI